jgi:mRNA-degrading endonuclease RelE of RelBE toxin-antitoxin system
MRSNPFDGDIVRLKNQRSTWRRRTGNYRIFFDLDAAKGIVDIVDVVRDEGDSFRGRKSQHPEDKQGRKLSP